MSKKNIIDIEDFSKNSKKVPSGHSYRIKIDKENYVVDQESITGRELLELANKTPYTKWLINLRLHGGGVKKIDYDEEVDLTMPGIEKFVTLPCDQTDGEELRKQFSLPEEDLVFLSANNLKWEAIVENGRVRWLIIKDFEIPNGYNKSHSNIALRIEPGYPVSQIDMVYFNPHLVPVNGKQINALANMQIDGNTWQRWSRHRTGANPWRPGLDDISTHLSLVDFWLKKEILN